MAETTSDEPAVVTITKEAEKRFGPVVVALVFVVIAQAAANVCFVVTIWFHGQQLCGALHESRAGHVQYVEQTAATNSATMAAMVVTLQRSVESQSQVNDRVIRRLDQMNEACQAMQGEMYELRKAALQAFKRTPAPSAASEK